MISHSTVTKNELKQHAIDMDKPQNQSWMKINKKVAEDLHFDMVYTKIHNILYSLRIDKKWKTNSDTGKRKRYIQQSTSEGFNEKYTKDKYVLVTFQILSSRGICTFLFYQKNFAYLKYFINMSISEIILTHSILINITNPDRRTGTCFSE